MTDRDPSRVEVAGLVRHFPLFEVAPGVRIAIFNMLGDTYVVKAAARDETTGEVVKASTSFEALSRVTESAVFAEFEQAPELLAGFRATVGSRVFDGSLVGQLEQLRRRITSEQFQ